MNSNNKDSSNIETDIKSFLVIGIGNSLLSDDGVGLHVIERAKKSLNNLDSFVDFKQNCTAGLDILYDIEGYNKVLLIDCMKTGRYKPGTFITLQMDNLEHFRQNVTTDSHALNLLTTIDAGKMCGYKMPRNIIILAIEGADITTFSENLTKDVEKCVDSIIQQIKHIILSWIKDEQLCVNFPP